MRAIFVLVVAMLGLAGCQTANQGSPGSCNQVGSQVDSTVMCPN